MSTKVASSAPKAIRRLQIQKESDLPKDACQTPGRLFYKGVRLPDGHLVLT